MYIYTSVTIEKNGTSTMSIEEDWTAVKGGGGRFYNFSN